MEENSYLQNCGNDDVLSFNDTLFKVGKIRYAVKLAFTEPRYVPDILYVALQQNGIQINPKFWLNNGVDCEVLKLGAKSWQKGKFRIRVNVEFIPDELEIPQTESPLDDLRKMIN
ncbi:KGK domain-containing protein [Coleofasciculus sp. H7-2]|uniref:KGK domain-containing protein n=1 Tax=Coleofasciculus sp. H7-2 TaxID=3351545 RepID=UPI003672B83E